MDNHYLLYCPLIHAKFLMNLQLQVYLRQRLLHFLGAHHFFYNLPTMASEADPGALLFDDPLYVDSEAEKDDHETPEAEAITMYPILVIAWTEVSIFLFNSQCFSNFISTE
jgi:hypothetical protein